MTYKPSHYVIVQPKAYMNFGEYIIISNIIKAIAVGKKYLVFSRNVNLNLFKWILTISTKFLRKTKIPNIF